VSTALHLAFSLNALLPRVEDPWPESVGLDLPFSAAGIGGVLGNLVAAYGSPEEQARATSLWGLWFFRFGALAYLLLLVNQVLSAG
jgi:hypothetical protein